MIEKILTPCKNWFHRHRKSRAQTVDTPLERGHLHYLATHRDTLPKFVQNCPVAQRYLDLLGILDWDGFLQREPQQAWPGTTPYPREPFVAAYLVQLDQHKQYVSELRTYLVEHPALIWILGFPLTPSTDYPWGFDVEASVPSTRLFLSVLRDLDNAVLQALLDNTVDLIGQEVPQDLNFGRTISIDTKHIVAWVKENNPKTFIKEGRYDKNKQPTGDPDCKLGVKRRSNIAPPDKGKHSNGAKTPTKNGKPASKLAVNQVYWGYASGVAATKVPDFGEVVLAEFTQTFNAGETSFFFPLMVDVERRLGFRPKYAALDKAFDAFYIYQYFHEVGGFAAIPLSLRGPVRTFDPQGLPLCEAKFPMPLKSAYTNRTSMVEHRRARFGCPLLLPKPTGQTCPIHHKRWPKGGCLTDMPLADGARIRFQLDRQSDLFKHIYKQRTATERINAQALALGIERPKLRNQRSITNRNSLIYILVNLRLLQRIRHRRTHNA